MTVIFYLLLIAFILGLILLWKALRRIKVAELENEIISDRVEQLAHFEQLRLLDARIEGEAEGQTKFAEDVHDSVGSLISSLNNTWYIHYTEQSSILKGKQLYTLNSINDIIENIALEIRKLTRETYVSTEDFDLEVALNDLQILSRSFKRFEINLFINGLKLLENFEELELYRIVTEALSNTLKYAEASHLNIHLNQTDYHLVLLIEDDGVGFDQSKHHIGIGLKNIKKRAHRLGGKCTIDSAINVGTTLIVEFDTSYKRYRQSIK